MTAEREELLAAAFRLKHDLGKPIRWNAPAVLEGDPEELRRRLALDLLETRVGPDGRARGAVEIFEAWLANDGALVRAVPNLAERLTRMSAAIDSIRRRLPALAGLGWEDLVALDDASRVVQEETRALWRESVAATSDGGLP